MNYEQMELEITLDGERELHENVMLSVEFAYNQLSRFEIPQVANRYEGYGIAANMWSNVTTAEKKVKEDMKHFLLSLEVGEQSAIETASSLYNSVNDVVYTATNMSAHVKKVMEDLYKSYSEIKTPIEEKIIEEGEKDGFEEAEEKEEEVQEDGFEEAEEKEEEVQEDGTEL